MLKKRTERLSLSERVSFYEPDYDKSASLIIAQYDIFCLPSRFEGFGLAALEAMLAGRVLLVSDIAGIAPHVKASGCGVVVKSNVLAVKKSNVLAVKEGLIELLQRRLEWKEMGLRERHYALKNLHWNKIAFSALEQYKKVLSL